MVSLEEIRTRIDEIDAAMRDLFEERMDLVYQVAEYKYKNNAKIFDSEREKEVVAQNAAQIKNPEYRELYIEFIHNVMDQSKEVQEKYIASQSVFK